MKPGRELDALVAEKVMEYPKFARQALDRLAEHVQVTYGDSEKCLICGRKDDTRECLPHYSTDIAAAWEVVEKLKLFVGLALAQNANCSWFVGERSSGEDLYPYVEGDTAPHGICLAALKALGVKINE